MDNLINIETKDGQLVVSSREVAKNFEKEHKNVIQAIENITAENSALIGVFFYSKRVQSRNRKILQGIPSYPRWL